MNKARDQGLERLRDYTGGTEGYKRTEVGMIPDDWEVCEIADLNPFITSGSRGWANFYSDRGAPFIRITNMSRKSIYLNLIDLKLVNLPSGVNEGMRTQLQIGDVLISITADIGIIGYINASITKPAYINQHIALVRFDLNKANSLFLSYFLACENSQKIFRGSTDLGAKAGMSLGTVRNIRLVLPPLSEQKAIALTLFDTDALIAACDRAITKKRNIKQGAMQQLLTGKMRLPSFSSEWEQEYKKTEVRVIPYNWKLKPLKAVSSMSGRIGWQGLKQEEFTFNTSEPFLITGMNFKDGKIRWEEVYHIPEKRYQEAKNIQLQEEDILMTKDGTIGKLLYVENIPFPGKASLNSHLLVFRPLNNSYYPKFLFYQLSFKQFTDYVDLNKSGSTFFGITQEAVGNYKAYLPPLPEQKAIAQILSDMDAEIAALEKKRDKYKAIKQGMMQELLTGKIRLNTDDTEIRMT